MLSAIELGQPVDHATFQSEVHQATVQVVRRQIEGGLDIINDGEVAKVGYVTYVRTRLAGFGGRGRFPGVGDVDDFLEYSKQFYESAEGLARRTFPACIGPIEWANFDEVEKEISYLCAALLDVNAGDAFLTAISPGVIAIYFANEFYLTYEEYLFKLAETMKREYDAIHKAGLVLQLDCPDLAYGRYSHAFVSKSTNAFLEYAALNIEAINYALKDIPPEAVRPHVRWGNYQGPHHRDEILGTLLRVRVGAL